MANEVATTEDYGVQFKDSEENYVIDLGSASRKKKQIIATQASVRTAHVNIVAAHQDKNRSFNPTDLFRPLSEQYGNLAEQYLELSERHATISKKVVREFKILGKEYKETGRQFASLAQDYRVLADMYAKEEGGLA